MPGMWALNGLDLERDFANGVWITERATLFRPPATVQRSVVKVPGRHGTLTAKPLVYDEAVMTIRMYCAVDTADPAHLEALVNDLIGLFAQPTLTLTRNHGGVVAYADADLVSITPEDFIPGLRARVTAVLALPDPFFRAAAALSANLGAGALQGIRVATLDGSTAPVTNAIVRVTGPVASANVTDLVTQSSLWWAGSGVTSGQYLYMNARTLTAWRSNSATQWEMGAAVDVTGGLNYSGGGPLQLVPKMEGTDPTDRRVKVNIETTGHGAGTEVRVYAGKAYL